MKYALLFFLLLFAACSAPKEKEQIDPNEEAQTESVCKNVRWDKQALSYCYRDSAQRLPSNESSVDIVYYWHSFGADIREIFADPVMTQDLATWNTKLGKRMPIIISLDASPEWIVGSSAASIVQSGLPLIEAQIAKGKTVRRYLMGRSLGARSALVLAGTTPSAFKAVAALCPALMLMNPYSASDIVDYESRNRTVLNRPTFERMVRVAKTAFRDSSSWTTYDPLNMIAAGSYDHTPIFLSVGSADHMGFAEGTSIFYSRLYARGDDVQQSIVESRLCAWDRTALFNFLNSQIP